MVFYKHTMSVIWLLRTVSGLVGFTQFSPFLKKDLSNWTFPFYLDKLFRTLPKKLIVFQPDLHAAIPQEMGQQSIKMPLDNLIWNLISKLTMLHT